MERGERGSEYRSLPSAPLRMLSRKKGEVNLFTIQTYNAGKYSSSLALPFEPKLYLAATRRETFTNILLGHIQLVLSSGFFCPDEGGAGLTLVSVGAGYVEWGWGGVWT